MATLASLTVALGIDTDRLRSGAAQAAGAIRSIGVEAGTAQEDVFGHMRALDGRIVSSAHANMTNTERIRDAWRGVGRVFDAVASTNLRRLRTGLSQAGSAGLKTAGVLGKTFGVLSVGAIGAAGALAAVPLAVVGLGAKIAAQNKGVQDSFTKLKDHVTKTMATVAQPLIKPIEQAAGQLGKIFDQLAPQLGQLFKAAAPMIQPLVQGIGGLVKGLVSGLVPVMKSAGPLVQALGRLFATLGKSVGGLFQGLSQGIGSAAPVFDALGSVIGALAPTLGKLMGQMLKIAGPILAKLLTALGPVIDQLGAALMPVIAALGPVLDALITAVVALLQAVLPLLPPLSQLIVALLPALTPILLALVPLINALAEVIVALVPILTPLITLVGKLATVLSDQLAKYINTILVPAVKAVAALLRGDWGQAWDYAKQAVKGAIKWVLGLFTKFPGQVWTAIQPLAGKLGSAASQAGAKLVTATKSGVMSALRWIGSLPGKAKAGLGDLGGVLKNAGASLIKGFIHGITSQFSNVKNTLGGLTSKLTSWKGPAPLDRKILTPAGQMVIGGFMRGIDKQAPLLRKQLQGLTSDLPGMTADISPRGVFSASMRNAQSIVFDVTGADEDMKRLIRRIVKSDGRGNVQTAFGQR